MQATPTERRIDLDIVFHWVRANTKRWNCNNPISALDDDADAERIRKAAAASLEPIAAQMTAAGSDKEKATPAETARWLGECLDDTASAPDGLIDAALVEPISPSRTAKCTPLRRWCAALREQAQEAGALWTRGRDTGPLALRVALTNNRWTITENGETKDDTGLRNGMIAAVAYALVRTAEDRRGPAPKEQDLRARLQAAADDYEQTGGRNA